MKKLLLTLLLVFLFIGCGKENFELDYFVDKWTTYLPANKQRTDSIDICFKIVYTDVLCFTYYLHEFDFNKNDSTIFFKVFEKNSIKYYGKYDEEKDMFIGYSHHYLNSGDSEYLLYRHKGVITTRGME